MFAPHALAAGKKALLSPPSAFRPGETVEKEKKGAFAASALDLPRSMSITEIFSDENLWHLFSREFVLKY